MKANELRIGNWVSDGEIDFKVESKDIYHLSVRVYGTVCNGIPITPEKMERLGFEKEGENLYKKNGVILCDDGFENEYRLCYYKAIINYVHQLQNLYHALTGEELEYKPNN